MAEPEKLSRRQIYEMVWRKPVEAVAAEIGLSGRGLGKLCERYGIPVPPRGYWARKSAGRRVVRPPLIEFGSEARDNPNVFVLPTVKGSQSPESPTASSTVNPFAQMWADQSAAIAPLRVAKALSPQPHAIVAKWLEEDRRRRGQAKSSFGFRGLPPLFDGSLDRRRLRIFDALFKTFDTMGLKSENDSRLGSRLVVRLNRDASEFTLSEYVRQYRRPPTEEEVAKGRSPRSSVQERDATGGLILKVATTVPKPVPARFRDQDGQPLEDQLHLAVAALLLAIAYERSARERREAEERCRWDESQRVRKFEEERKAEETRKAALRVEASAWRDATLLREYVAAVRAEVQRGRQVPGKVSLEGWSAWALRHADEIDPLVVEENVEARAASDGD